jgi:hypothetical protein
MCKECKKFCYQSKFVDEFLQVKDPIGYCEDNLKECPNSEYLEEIQLYKCNCEQSVYNIKNKILDKSNKK